MSLLNNHPCIDSHHYLKYCPYQTIVLPLTTVHTQQSLLFVDALWSTFGANTLTPPNRPLKIAGHSKFKWAPYLENICPSIMKFNCLGGTQSSDKAWACLPIWNWLIKNTSKKLNCFFHNFTFNTTHTSWWYLKISPWLHTSITI